MRLPGVVYWLSWPLTIAALAWLWPLPGTQAAEAVELAAQARLRLSGGVNVKTRDYCQWLRTSLGDGREYGYFALPSDRLATGYLVLFGPLFEPAESHPLCGWQVDLVARGAQFLTVMKFASVDHRESMVNYLQETHWQKGGPDE